MDYTYSEQYLLQWLTERLGGPTPVTPITLVNLLINLKIVPFEVAQAQAQDPIGLLYRTLGVVNPALNDGLWIEDLQRDDYATKLYLLRNIVQYAQQEDPPPPPPPPDDDRASTFMSEQPIVTSPGPPNFADQAQYQPYFDPNVAQPPTFVEPQHPAQPPTYPPPPPQMQFSPIHDARGAANVVQSYASQVESRFEELNPMQSLAAMQASVSTSLGELSSRVSTPQAAGLAAVAGATAVGGLAYFSHSTPPGFPRGPSLGGNAGKAQHHQTSPPIPRADAPSMQRQNQAHLTNPGPPVNADGGNKQQPNSSGAGAGPPSEQQQQQQQQQAPPSNPGPAVNADGAVVTQPVPGKATKGVKKSGPSTSGSDFSSTNNQQEKSNIPQPRWKTEGEEPKEIPLDVETYFNNLTSFHYLITGFFRHAETSEEVRFVFVPSYLSKSSNFSIDSVWPALGLPKPEILFEFGASSAEIKKANLKLPAKRQEQFNRDKNNFDQDHYRGVMQGSLNKLLVSISSSCGQANAYFRWEGEAETKEDVQPSSQNVASLPGEEKDDEPDDQLAPMLHAATRKASADPTPIICLQSMVIDADKQYFNPLLVALLFSEARRFPAKDGAKYNSREKVVEMPLDWTSEKRVLDKTVIRMPSKYVSHVIFTSDFNNLNRKFHESLPHGLIMFGGSSISNVRQVEDCIQGSIQRPLFLFEFVGGATDLVVEFFRKYSAHRRIIRGGQSKALQLPFGENYTTKTQKPEGWLNAMDDEMIKVAKALNILYETINNFDEDKVCILDIFDTTDLDCVDQITKVMASASLTRQELGATAGEERRLAYAWRLRQMMVFNAKRMKVVSDVLTSLIILFSFSSTAASILYVGFKSHPDLVGSSVLPWISVLNILLPLVVTICKGVMASQNPRDKYVVLKSAGTRIESEIYFYRTRTGDYNGRSKAAPGEVTDQDNGNDENERIPATSDPKKVFQENIDKILNEVYSSDINKASLTIPWENPMIRINKRISSNFRLQKMLSESSVMPLRSNSIFACICDIFTFIHDVFSHIYESIVHFFESCFSCFLHWFCCKADDYIAPPAHVDVQQKNLHDADEERGRTEVYGEIPQRGTITATPQQQGRDTQSDSNGTPQQQDQNNASSGKSSPSLYNWFFTEKNTVGQSLGRKRTKKEQKQETIIRSRWVDRELEDQLREREDDGMSKLSADDYVQQRLLPWLATFAVKSPSLSKGVTFVTVSTIFLSVASSVLSSFDLMEWIPLALAFSSCLTSAISYTQSEIRLAQVNGGYKNLTQLLVWWNSLGVVERRSASNKEILVLRTEHEIQNQIVGYVNTSKSMDKMGGDSSNGTAGSGTKDNNQQGAQTPHKR